jgi:hypothetical protein
MLATQRQRHEGPLTEPPHSWEVGIPLLQSTSSGSAVSLWLRFGRAKATPLGGSPRARRELSRPQSSPNVALPPTPESFDDLDLVKRLAAYAAGSESYHEDEAVRMAPAELKAAGALLVGLRQFVEQLVGPILNRTTSGELSTFTLHDETHGRKVAHLAWCILDPERRRRLSPPEIVLIVAAAYFHDMGMALSPNERKLRLPQVLERISGMSADQPLKRRIDDLRRVLSDQPHEAEELSRIQWNLHELEEVALADDTRERHATRERYEELLAVLRAANLKDPEAVPSVDSCLSQGGDSLVPALIEVCTSHGESADCLAEASPEDPSRRRFRAIPIGRFTVDTHLAAACLRLGDILDFDRERTPPILFYYLVSPPSGSAEQASIREWTKHLSISNWEIGRESLIFRGRCSSPVVHKAILDFTDVIRKEVVSTLDTFEPAELGTGTIALPREVRTIIDAEGYTYFPYSFSLDDDRIHKLLMGGAIYSNPLDAIRELIQNSVDACLLRDALTQLHDPAVTPTRRDRIVIRFTDRSGQDFPPTLTVEDSGVGMDEATLKGYFLRVGCSYYDSDSFFRTRIELRRAGLDFAPVSEFGVGFLACFLLSDRVQVETSSWASPSGDTAKRTLTIDGPTRLIHLRMAKNQGVERFKGTKVTLVLRPRAGSEAEPADWAWSEIRQYILRVCQELPYDVLLTTSGGPEPTTDVLRPVARTITLAPEVEKFFTRITVGTDSNLIEGEIAIPNFGAIEGYLEEKTKGNPDAVFVTVREMGPGVEDLPDDHGHRTQSLGSSLLRGGFLLGPVPGLPEAYSPFPPKARLSLKWRGRSNAKLPETDLARSHPSARGEIAAEVARIWMSHFLEDPARIALGQLGNSRTRFRGPRDWRFLQPFGAYRVFLLARSGWVTHLRGGIENGQLGARFTQWENSMGPPLPLGGFGSDLYRSLLDLVMPKFTAIVEGAEGRLSLEPPRTGWKPEAERCTDFVSQPVSWGRFATFEKGIENLLFYSYPGTSFLNLKFKDRMDWASSTELQALPDIFDSILAGQKYPTIRPRMDAPGLTLMEKAIKEVGDLQIGTINGIKLQIREIRLVAEP